MSGYTTAVVAVVGAVTSFVSSQQQASAIKQAGRAEQVRAQYVSDQNKVNAGQAQAASQREALEVRRRQSLAQSEATNVAAAQGGTLDNTFEGIMAGIEEEGTFRKNSALFDGDNKARSMNMSAQLSEFDGNNAMSAANQSAKNTKFEGYTNLATSLGGTFASKYTPKTETDKKISMWKVT